MLPCAGTELGKVLLELLLGEEERSTSNESMFTAADVLLHAGMRRQGCAVMPVVAPARNVDDLVHESSWCGNGKGGTG
jgi:hypothetical protein